MFGQPQTKAGDSLKQIMQMAEHVAEMITQIATAASQQSSTTEEITRNLDKISKLVTEPASEAQRSAAACHDLSALAVDLEQMVGSFKLDSACAVQPEAPHTAEPCARVDDRRRWAIRSQRRNSTAVAMKNRNTTEITPFIVKNAALSLLRLSDETNECS